MNDKELLKIEIKHRFTGAVLFVAEVEASDERPLRTAVLRAVAAGADLADADLARAYLAGADLAGANLADANLARAYLADANLAGANLADANLARAYLADANLAGANLADANLARADLAGANLAGADLARAYLARAYLAGADLAGADLAGANLAGADLADANLAGANLAGADLAGANLAGADLAGANLADANLAGADLAGANLARAEGKPTELYVWNPNPSAEQLTLRAERYRVRHPEVPVVPQLDSKILDAIDKQGCTLDMSDWHTCETTHCRAGFSIHLAGKAGYDLERQHGSHRAGAMIYRASTGRVPHFFATNRAALEDIKACAAREVSGNKETL